MMICKHFKELDGEIDSYEYCRAEEKISTCAGCLKQCNYKEHFCSDELWVHLTRPFPAEQTTVKYVFTGKGEQLKPYFNFMNWLNTGQRLETIARPPKGVN